MKYFAAVLLFLVACDRMERPALSRPETDGGLRARRSTQVDAGENLLDLGRGAAVVSRTGELHLEVSAANAIDGDPLTIWRSAPASPEETLVFALPARSRIARVGVVGVTVTTESPQQVRFDASDDGAAWRTVATMGVKPEAVAQTVDVAPFEASYLRMQTIEKRDYYSSVGAALAFGREIAPRADVSIDGCWTINGWPARFAVRGTSVAGIIGSDPPIVVAGGADARRVRLSWRQGMMWGFALIAIDPRTRALSGVRWHEQVGRSNSGDGWLGVPLGVGLKPDLHCDGVIDEVRIAEVILQRAGYWMLYGDDALETAVKVIARAPSSRGFRIVARDAARLGQVRAALQARGADLARIEFTTGPPSWSLETSPQRAMADGVELRLR